MYKTLKPYNQIQSRNKVEYKYFVNKAELREWLQEVNKKTRTYRLRLITRER